VRSQEVSEGRKLEKEGILGWKIVNERNMG
jgi:hypothetical protein